MGKDNFKEDKEVERCDNCINKFMLTLLAVSWVIHGFQVRLFA
jgi:hypothetical protein